MPFLFHARRAPGKQRFSLALATWVAIGVWSCDAVGWINFGDNALYDLIVRLQTAFYSPSVHTVLCYVEPEASSAPAQLENLIGIIAAASPRGIAFTFSPPKPHTALRVSRDNSAEPTDDVPQNADSPDENVTSPDDEDSLPIRNGGGPWILDSVEVIESPVITTPPTPLRQVIQIADAVVTLPTASDGVHRWHHPFVERNRVPVPTLESRIATLQGVDTSTLKERFRVQYCGAAGSLPYVLGADVVQHKIVPQLFTDAVVLLGVRSEGPYAGIATPTTTGDFLMTPLEYHGHVVNTLLSKQTVTDIVPWLQFGLLLIISSALPRLHRRSKLGPGICLLIATGSLTMLAAGVTLWFGCLWIRPASFILLQWVSCCVAWETEIRELQRKTRSFCLDVISDQRRQAWPSQFVSTSVPWENVSRLFQELLSPCRFVLLRTLDQQMYLREAERFECEPEDIIERRRDFRRYPFETADEEGRPILLPPERLFFKPVDGESQYLAPLKFRGVLVGFAIVAVSQCVLDQNPEYVDTIRRLADQAAQMLQRRRALIEQQGDLPSDSTHSTIESWRELLAVAAVSARRVSGKVSRLEGVVSVSPQASLVFDLYGNLLLTNARMVETLADEGISAERESPLTLISKIAGAPTDEIRSVIRRAIGDQVSHVRPVTLPQSGTAYFLHLTLVEAKAMGRVVDDVYPFDLLGIRLDLLPAVGVGTLDWLDELETVEPSAKVNSQQQKNRT